MDTEEKSVRPQFSHIKHLSSSDFEYWLLRPMSMLHLLEITASEIETTRDMSPYSA
jgi:hypothetical protein